MAKILRAKKVDFETKVKSFLETAFKTDPEVKKTVSEIIAAIREKGDEALLEYTKRFDNAEFSDAELRVSKEEMEQAEMQVSEEVLGALTEAARRIESYHYQQMPNDKTYQDVAGVKLGWKWTPVESAGIYVPGGTAAYPSTVLMNAIPARIAGSDRVVMVVPAPNGELNPLVIAAANIAGVEEIYKIGGAQAIAALAYGTETIPKVDKIVGPGNQYVAEAKRQVFGDVGIDMIAGPSEVLIISDKKSNAKWIATDLMSQAEHDVNARSILVTDDEDFANKVNDEVNSLLKEIERSDIARESWKNNGLVVIVDDLYEAVEVSNMIAPEHLQLAVTSPSKFIRKVTNAGAIFLGRYTPEAIGDYMAGPSHVLPTGGSARFSSGLSVYDFLKRSSIIGCDDKAFTRLARETEILAREEGLECHARSITVRKGGLKKLFGL